jgi:hypothetical protein
MKKWLYWFDNRMCYANKKVLLLINNFLAYKLKVKQIIKKGELIYTKVYSF